MVVVVTPTCRMKMLVMALDGETITFHIARLLERVAHTLNCVVTGIVNSNSFPDFG